MKTLAGIRRSIPPSCHNISEGKSWLTFARIILLLAVCLYAEAQTDNLWLLLPLWIIHGQVLVGLFVLGHDCGHQAFSRNRTTNAVMGHIAFSPLGNGLRSWVTTHNHHHAHTQLRGQDVDWSKWLMTSEELKSSGWKKNFAGKLGYKLPFGIFFWVWLNAIRRGSGDKSNLVMWTVMLGIYGVLVYFTGIYGMFKYHGIPATIAMFTGYFLLTIQHANGESMWFEEKSWAPVRGQMESTFDVRFPRVLEWLWLDINIHVPHHISPGMPWYELRTASEHLRREHPGLYRERKFSLKEITWMIRTPLLHHDVENGTYRLVK